MVFEICAAVITLMLIVLIVYLVKFLNEARDFLRSSRKTLEKLETETIPLVRSSTEILDKAHKQMDEFDPLMKSVSNVGNYFNEATSELPYRSASLEIKKKLWQENVIDILELVSVGLKVFKQFQKRR